MKKTYFFIFLWSVIATLLSVFYMRDYLAVTGNICLTGLCRDLLPSGGFPVAYLYDSGLNSVSGVLFVEDTFSIGWFVFDLIFFFILFNLGYLAYQNSFKLKTGKQV